MKAFPAHAPVRGDDGVGHGGGRSCVRSPRPCASTPRRRSRRLTDLGSSPKIMGPTYRVTAAARRAAGGFSARRGTVAVVAALVLLTWPVTSLLAQANLDNSAIIGLSLAVSRGLAFGRQVVYTYGPLGFV